MVDAIEIATRADLVSTLCQKQSGGSISCYNDHILRQIAHSGTGTGTVPGTATHSQILKGRPKSCDSPNDFGRSPSKLSKHSSGKSRCINTRTLLNHTTRFNNWLSERSVRDVQEKSDTEAKGTKKIFDHLLQAEQNLSKEVYDLIDYKSMLQLRRKELLHKKWVDRVYEPLRKKIIDEMGSVNWVMTDLRRRELYTQYLEHRNKRGHIFLDTDDPEEYYGLALNGYRPAPLKVHTRRLKDPLLSQGTQRCEEDRAVLRCLTGSQFSDKDIEQVRLPLLPLVPSGRHGTECATWKAMHLGNVESGYRLASRRRMRGTNNVPSTDFYEWVDPSKLSLGPVGTKPQTAATSAQDMTNISGVMDPGSGVNGGTGVNSRSGVTTGVGSGITAASGGFAAEGGSMPTDATSVDRYPTPTTTMMTDKSDREDEGDDTIDSLTPRASCNVVKPTRHDGRRLSVTFPSIYRVNPCIDMTSASGTSQVDTMQVCSRISSKTKTGARDNRQSIAYYTARHNNKTVNLGAAPKSAIFLGFPQLHDDTPSKISNATVF